MDNELKEHLNRCNLASVHHLAKTFGMNKNTLYFSLRGSLREAVLGILKIFADDPVLVQECFQKFGGNDEASGRIPAVQNWLLFRRNPDAAAIAERLQAFNAWRRGDDSTGFQNRPEQLGKDLDLAIKYLKQL